MNKNDFVTKLVFLPMLLGTTGQTVLAADNNNSQATDEKVEKISVIGSRSAKQRSVADSTVPIDLISEEDINAIGNTADITDNLKALVPSYIATPATGDGSAFVRPTSLRGTAPDQTLVLIDGKRRHRSALVQFFAPAAGNGAHGADVAMIPSIALKRIEVLRDGASSQYGSDAIAGVINFVTKDASEGGTVNLQYGQFYEGESSIKFGFNKGLELGENGFANFSLEYVDNEALSRGLIRPDAQSYIDSGVQGVGADSPFGDAPFTQTWGRPETDALRLFLNAGVELDGNMSLYSRVNYADTSGRYRFFYRNQNHSTLTALKALGFTGKQTEVGFTPYLDGDQKDFSIIFGLEGEFANDTTYDFSISHGSNELDYFLSNTVNPDLGLDSNLQIPQMDFNVGGYKQQELNINADFSTTVGEDLNVAYGAEWRKETYTSIAGEPNSYLGAGSSGFKGINPNDAGDVSRDNYAVYIDVEHDVTDALLMQYALRYEDFSDFGGTTNYKVAANYSVTDDFSLRGAVSTGFHAPTPGQSSVSSIITTFDGTTGLQVEEGLIPATHPLAIQYGGQKIKEEESTNISLGFVTNVGEATSITLDAYKISVDDRIYRTGNIATSDSTSISFYTNALDVEHQGIDLVVTSEFDSIDTNIALSYSYNTIDVVGQRSVSGQKPVSDATVEDIENNFPNSRFVLTSHTVFSDDLSLMLRANYYGSHYDERGRIGAAENPTAEIGATIYFDAELSYQFSEEVQVKFGVTNLFDSYVDEIDAPYANRRSVGLQYPRRSAANYEGGSWYLGVSYDF
ncbi:TonB-dependent receptor [Parashewanella spongiae]|uniref:TonB-dependent receptor n=1 Tax=Parashewanella spongiae TaxID=342950 RepID=A0A3A6U9H7_9GAMM|nr:TonB-dependent receptor [Parashewanella spongiae]MCL1077321.1 TonB-dependent receptor [Parashewanella spongiae]RJY18592.1 TonB-dependent receptor [Parashewanella spongiae]